MKKGWHWTKADDARLRRLYPTCSAAHLARLFKRSAVSIYKRASVLGIAKVPEAPTKRRFWTAAEIATLKRQYPTVAARHIAAKLGYRVSQVLAKAHALGLRKAPATIARLARESVADPRHPSRGYRFPKGHVPANKGVKGWQAGGRSRATQFKPGTKPPTTKPLCSIALRDGLLYVKVNDAGYGPTDWKPLQRLVWEYTHGPIPPKHLVRFKDGNPRNFADDNLECISLRENMARNTVHNLPKALAQVVQLTGALKRQINRRTREEQNRRSS